MLEKMFDKQFLQVQLKSDFHWLSSGNMRTKQNLKYLVWQSNRQQQTQRGGGTIVSDHLSRVWLIHCGKCLSCLPVCPPARQSPSRLLLLGRLRTSEQTNPLWSPCRQTADDLSLEWDINLISTPSKNLVVFLFSSLFFVSAIGSEPRLSCLPKCFFFHVKPCTKLCSSSTVVLVFDTCHLRPLFLSWPSASESDVGPCGGALRFPGTWRLAAVGCRLQPGLVNKQPFADHFWNWSFHVTRAAFFLSFFLHCTQT